jgi:hypothetical protein
MKLYDAQACHSYATGATANGWIWANDLWINEMAKRKWGRNQEGICARINKNYGRLHLSGYE